MYITEAMHQQLNVVPDELFLPQMVQVRYRRKKYINCVN